MYTEGKKSSFCHITSDGWILFYSLHNSKRTCEQRLKDFPNYIALRASAELVLESGPRKPQLWSSTLAPSTDAKADGRAGIICRKAADLQASGEWKALQTSLKCLDWWVLTPRSSPGDKLPTLSHRQQHDGWCASCSLQSLCSYDPIRHPFGCPCLEIVQRLLVFHMLRKTVPCRVQAKIQSYSQ